MEFSKIPEEFDGRYFDIVEQIGVPIKKYDRVDVAEHVGFARLFWVNGKRFLMVEGLDEEDFFEIVFKSDGYEQETK